LGLAQVLDQGVLEVLVQESRVSKIVRLFHPFLVLEVELHLLQGEPVPVHSIGPAAHLKDEVLCFAIVVFDLVEDLPVDLFPLLKLQEDELYFGADESQSVFEKLINTLTEWTSPGVSLVDGLKNVADHRVAVIGEFLTFVRGGDSVPLETYGCVGLVLLV